MTDENDPVAAAACCFRKAAVLFCLGFAALFVTRAAQANYASLVMDATNGRVLYEANSDLPHYPASLTKMMSLYLLFEALDGGRMTLDEPLPVSEHAAEQSPTKLGLRPGQWITVEDAILGLVTKSANDAAVVIAESVGGSESRFASMMTTKAHALGMSQTNFANASGLPDSEQVTTAHDMALLALALLHDYPDYYHYFGTERFYYGGGVHPNHNRMLGQYQGLDGIKTGYTVAAGYNLVASAERDGRRIIGVVLGARSSGNRQAIMTDLLDQAFGGGEIVVATQGQGLPARVVPAAYAAPIRTAAVSRAPRRVGTPPPSSLVARTVRGHAAPAAKSQLLASRAAHVAPAKAGARPGGPASARATTSGSRTKSAPAVLASSTRAPKTLGRVAAPARRLPTTATSRLPDKPKTIVLVGSTGKSGGSKPAKPSKAAAAASKHRIADAGRRPPS